MMIKRTLLVSLAVLLAACGGGGGGDGSASTPPVGGGPPAPPPPTVGDITLLFMGNSHTSVNNLTGMVTDMVRAGKPGKSVASIQSPGGMFLDERLSHAPSLDLLRSQDWSFVILQAQKYSSSGTVQYSTAEAQQWVRMSRAQHAVPIMFPEWPRRGIDETQRIFDLHVSIAQAEPACVAPIPQAFDLALARHPTLILHDTDGNHSSEAGAFLAALVLYATITGLSPLDLPPLPQFPVSASLQATLREVAAETVLTVPPRMWCPGDAI
jgi:hypothetical protein